MDLLNPDDPRPPYQQVADALRGDIRAGTYEPGAKLPPHAAVAETFGISVGPVKRAFAALQDEGLIVTRQGQGSYVRTPLADQPVALGDPEVAELRRVVEALNDRVGKIERQLSGSES